jgi:hypothetical protein
MNSRAVTLFVLSAAWLALGVPCAAQQGAAPPPVQPRANLVAQLQVQPPVLTQRLTTHDRAYQAALDAASATRKASRDSAAALVKARRYVRSPSDRNAQAARRAARKTQLSAHHAWQTALVAADLATGGAEIAAREAAHASEQASMAWSRALEQLEVASERTPGANRADAKRAAATAYEALGAARGALRSSARVSHGAAEASWRARRQALEVDSAATAP